MPRVTQFGRSSESFTDSVLRSDAYQVAEKAKKLAHEVTSLAGQLHNVRGVERRRPLMPLVRRLRTTACACSNLNSNCPGRPSSHSRKACCCGLGCKAV